MLEPHDYAQLAEFLLEKGLVETERALRKESSKFNSSHAAAGPYASCMNSVTSFPNSLWTFSNPAPVPGGISGGGASLPCPVGHQLGSRTMSLPASPVQGGLVGGKAPVSAPASLRGSCDLDLSGSCSLEEVAEKSGPLRTRRVPCFQVRPVMDKRQFQITELQLEDSTEESLKSGSGHSSFKGGSLSSGLEASPATSTKAGDHSSERELSPVFELMPPVVPQTPENKDVKEDCIETGGDTKDGEDQLSRVGSLSESTQEITDAMQGLTLPENSSGSEQCAQENKNSSVDQEATFNFSLVADPQNTQPSAPQGSHPKPIIPPLLKDSILTRGSQDQKSVDAAESGFSFPLTPRSEDENEPIFATWQSFHSRCSGDASVSSLARALSIEGAPSSTGDCQGKEDALPFFCKSGSSHRDEWEVMLAHKSKEAKEGKAKETFLMSTGGSFHTGADPSNCASSDAGQCEYEGGGNYLDGCQLYAYSEDYINERYDIIDLKIFHKRGTTGFESSKELHMEQGDVVAGRYQVVSVVGTAAFSQAVEAYDLKEQRPVCLKMVKNNKDFFDQSLDEIKLLRYVNACDPDDEKGVVRMYHFFYYKEHLFLVFELLSSNLYEVQRNCLKSSSEPYYFTMRRIQSIAVQVLSSLSFLHGLKIIHSDLKPENILMKSMDDCEVKVIDLGSSCFTTDYLGSYVQSRSYRAPEVILGLQYDQKVDIWSLGCVLAELAAGYVLFQSSSLAGLLARVESCRGLIPKEMVDDGSNSHKFFTVSRRIFRETRTHDYEILIPTQLTLGDCIPGVDDGFLGFLSMLLTIDPHDRPSAIEALGHPWLQHDYGNTTHT